MSELFNRGAFEQIVVYSVSEPRLKAKVQYQIGLSAAQNKPVICKPFDLIEAEQRASFGRYLCAYIAYRRVKRRRAILVVTCFSNSPLRPQFLNTPSVPFKPYLHLQCKVARDTSPPSNRYLILPEAVRDRASIRRIGPCFRLWP